MIIRVAYLKHAIFYFLVTLSCMCIIKQKVPTLTTDMPIESKSNFALWVEACCHVHIYIWCSNMWLSTFKSTTPHIYIRESIKEWKWTKLISFTQNADLQLVKKANFVALHAKWKLNSSYFYFGVRVEFEIDAPNCVNWSTMLQIYKHSAI